MNYRWLSIRYWRPWQQFVYSLICHILPSQFLKRKQLFILHEMKTPMKLPFQLAWCFLPHYLIAFVTELVLPFLPRWRCARFFKGRCLKLMGHDYYNNNSPHLLPTRWQSIFISLFTSLTVECQIFSSSKVVGSNKKSAKRLKSLIFVIRP